MRELYSKVRKTHNSGVFDAYTDEMKRARKSGILTGLPDGYGRGRIIGDYRRVALYGVDALVEAKKADLKNVLLGVMDDEKIRLREEVQEQIRWVAARAGRRGRGDARARGQPVGRARS
jgi:formate C-acetyltransferase